MLIHHLNSLSDHVGAMPAFLILVCWIGRALLPYHTWRSQGIHYSEAPCIFLVVVPMINRALLKYTVQRNRMTNNLFCPVESDAFGRDPQSRWTKTKNNFKCAYMFKCCSYFFQLCFTPVFRRCHVVPNFVFILVASLPYVLQLIIPVHIFLTFQTCSNLFIPFPTFSRPPDDSAHDAPWTVLSVFNCFPPVPTFPMF